MSAFAVVMAIRSVAMQISATEVRTRNLFIGWGSKVALNSELSIGHDAAACD